MPCGAYADDRVTPPLVPTQPASPTNNVMQSASDARPGPTITLPPLKERPMPTMSLYPHRKRANARKGILAGDSAAPTTWDATMDVIQTLSTNNEQQTANGNEPLVLGGAPAAIGARLVTTQNGPLNAETAATQSSMATATIQDGPLNVEAADHSQAATATTLDGPFDADVFLNSVDNNDPPPSPRVLAAAAPSTSRTMRKQTEKSFDSRTGVEKSKGKSKSTGSPLDNAPKGFSETDLVYYNHIGLTPPVSGDSAAAFRERVTQNEVKTVSYVVSQERKNSAAIKDTNSRLEEFAKLMADFKSYLASAPARVNADPDFLELHNAVSINRETIENILDALPSTEFYDEIDELTTNIEELQKKADDADRVEVRTQIAALKELAGTMNPPAAVPSTFTPAAPVTRNMQSSTAAAPVVMHGTLASAPLVGQVPQNGQSYAAAPAMTGAFAGVQPVTQSGAGIISPLAGGAQQAPSLNTSKRGAPAKYAPRNKRARLDALSENSDIVYGPVSVNGALPNVADAAIQFLVQAAGRVGEHAALGMDDVVSTQVARGHTNMISIRFRSREKAGVFASLVQRFTPIAGQTASFRGEAPTHGGASAGPSSTQALLDVLQGTGNQASQRSMYNSLRIIAWNIGGNLAIKITEPHTLKLINANDIIIFQETWMRPEQEHSLPLPKGFDVIARSRSNGGSMRGSKGGVAIVLRSDLCFKVLEDLSGPDLIALEMDNLYLIGAYILPSTNLGWWVWTDVHPKVRFAEALAWCTANRAKPTAAIADLNGRTKSDTPSSSVLERSSMDAEPTNTRGTWILNTCEDSRMEILNGTRFEKNSPGDWTSFQWAGQAVVDYALFSRDFLSILHPNTLQVIRVPDTWSDHAILSLHVTFPLLDETTGPTPSLTLSPTQNDADVVPRSSPTPCDRLAQETIEAAQTDEEATLNLYGTVSRLDSRRLRVHVASLCKNQGRVDARAAFGVYWGENSSHNTGWCIAGRQVDGRALLTGMLYALVVSNPERSLEVFTTSKYAIRAICYAAGKNNTRGWDCANGDLLELIANVIRKRTFQITFCLVHQPQSNTAHSGARSLALVAASATSRSIYAVPDVPAHTSLPDSTSQRHLIPKVVTALPKDDPPKPKAAVNVTAAQLAIGDKPDAHRNRLTVRRLQSENLNRLLNAESIREWWQIMRELTDTKPRDARVTAAQLRAVFKVRLNPPVVMPAHFDADLKRLRDLMSAAIPPITIDHTPELFFSRPFVLPDIERMKRKLRDRSTKSALGIDHCSYKKIQSIPNEALLKLFNYCTKNGTGPQDWFTTILVGILKMGKPSDDPESYRLVGLECCLLKCLTLLIDMRIRAWAETYNILPDSQNGFREKYRTHNNSFILRCAIDHARAQGKPLYVAFVDLTNAFPSTDLPTLWMKLYAAGVSGPLFDWLRMLYARMSYVVRQGSELTAAFKSLIGVLTGDTASPILWNVYFADLADVFGPDVDDLCLNGHPVSHVEQADDVALFSTTAAGLQRKIDLFFGWCRVNFMVISATKTEWMLFGELPPTIPKLTVGTTVIKLVKSYKFVGLIFTSINRDAFAAHYKKKASKARAVANTTFAAKAMIGTLPPYEGIRLYMARIDPHLTFGCEVGLDVVADHLTQLTDVQHEFIRRLLGVNRRSILAVLFTETGVVPLRYRRIGLALGYLTYLITLPPNHFAHAAYRDSLLLAQGGHPSWISDLHHVMQSLPVPVQLSASDLTVDGVAEIRKHLLAACDKWLADSIALMSSRLPLLQGRLERNEDGKFVATAMKLRQYLRVPVLAHRKALTRLLLSSHTLGIEILRWKERYKVRVPRDSRLCRFCRLAIESESHATIGCTAPALVALRYDFLKDIYCLVPDLPRRWTSTDEFLRALVQYRNFDLTQRLAKYTYDVFEVYATFPVFRPAEYLYNTLE